MVANGIDPGEKAKLDKVAASVAAANTFEAVADELLAKTEREGLSAITLKKNRWLIGFITPVLGRRPIAEITAHELLSVLRSVETRGRHETAKRMRAICSVGERRVGRLMRLGGIKPVRTRKHKITTNSNHNLGIVANVLDGNFTADAPNRKWAGDISYIWTAQGWLYLAVILDLPFVCAKRGR